MVVITSTVMPGSTGGEIKAALEAASGRKVGPDLGLCYNPEFIALGSVVRDMLYPDSILIGESDTKAGDVLQTIYLQMCEKKPPVQRMNFVNAELTKISVNTYVTTKISYANMLADICDRLPGADVDVVTKALGADTRIGSKYLKGAMGYGGPCFPRDNVAFAALARKIGARADVAEATDRINNHQIDRLTGLVAKFAKAGTRIALLGLVLQAADAGGRGKPQRQARRQARRRGLHRRRCTIRWRRTPRSPCWATRWSAPPRSRARCASATS